jgi:short-subunit dehydrogenase
VRALFMNKNRTDVVVLTGASAGVGRATAKKFAEHGCSIGLIARGMVGLEGAKRDVEKLGGKALILKADVAVADEIEKAASRVEEEFGSIDIWINNAMTTVFSSFKDIKPEEFKRVTEVTYLSFVYGTMAALKRMRERNKGVIVQVGSALAYRGIPLQSAYCGAKHAIQGFNESVRSELIHDKINVHLTMIQMPALNTPQFNWCKTNFDKKPQPVPPIYQPEIAADAIYFAAYHPRRELFVGFRNTVIMWGNKFFHGFGDRYLAKNGYESQMLDQKVDVNRPSNLWEPVDDDKDFGAHGDFDKQAVKESWHLKINKHKEVFIPAVTAVVVLIVIVMIIII